MRIRCETEKYTPRFAELILKHLDVRDRGFPAATHLSSRLGAPECIREVDHELAFVCIVRIATSSRLKNFGDWKFTFGFADVRIHRPKKSVAEAESFIRRRPGRGIPEGDDIVRAFTARGQFDQVNFTVSPVAARFNPNTGDTVVRVEQVLVIGKDAIALKQAEAAHVVRGKDLVFERLGIPQRGPDEFVVLEAHKQTVAIVNFGTIVVGLSFGVFAE